MRINTNIASLNAQAQNTQTNTNLTNSLEKLSSGLKINKAADDASGMAIADKLRTQASSVGQGIANANSGSALIQIADKAMEEQSNILDIVKTKLLQAATSTTSDEGREAIRKDVSKLLEQIDNISLQTTYNGVNLLNEKGANFNFQVGEKASDVIGTTTAYAVNTTGLGAGADQTIEDEDTRINVGDEVYLATSDSQISLQSDLATAPTASHDRSVNIGDATAASGTTGITSYTVEAENVSALVFESQGGGTVTAETSDAALKAAFDANTDMTRVSEGVYTMATGVNFAVEFSEKVNIVDLTISGAEMGNAQGSNDALGVVTDEFVTVTKLSGEAHIGFSNGEFEAGTDTTLTSNTNDLIAKGNATADGWHYNGGALGPELEEGTMAVQYDSTLIVPANTAVGIAIDNASATATDEASYTLNAESVGQMNIASGSNHEVTLSTNDATMMATLDEMAANNANLTKINEGAYQFKVNTAGDTANIDFGGAELRDLTISGQTSAEIITIETDKAVSVTKNGNTTDDNHLLLNGATINTNTKVVTADQGNLVGAKTDAVTYSNTLAGLTSLGEGELTSEIANQYMSTIDNAMTQLNAVRSDFGSTQNQLAAATRNMMVTKVNIEAAESVIRDVDYAAESANFNKQNIISQAGTYALSQANQVQQNVLRLLQ